MMAKLLGRRDPFRYVHENNDSCLLRFPISYSIVFLFSRGIDFG